MDLPSYAAAVAAARPENPPGWPLSGVATLLDQAAADLVLSYDWLNFAYAPKSAGHALEIAASLEQDAPTYPDRADEIRSAAAAIRAATGGNLSSSSGRADYENRRQMLLETAQFFRAQASGAPLGEVLPQEKRANEAINAARNDYDKKVEDAAKKDLCNPVRLLTGESTFAEFRANCLPKIPSWLKVLAVAVPAAVVLVGAAYVYRSFR